MVSPAEYGCAIEVSRRRRFGAKALTALTWAASGLLWWLAIDVLPAYLRSK
jgi:hypothetical protein